MNELLGLAWLVQELYCSIDQWLHRKGSLFPTRIGTFAATVQAQVEPSDNREFIGG